MFSGNNAERVNVVGILISSKCRKCLKGFNPISEEIITARFYSRFRNITVIQCCAPTDPSDDTANDSFYCQLEGVLSNRPKDDIVVILVDFNAKIANHNNGVQTIMGWHVLATSRSNNGERLIEFCAAQNFFFGGTRFPHQDRERCGNFDFK